MSDAMPCRPNMQTTYFDQGAVNRMRRAAVRAAELPPDLPECWCRSPVDPGKILAAFPSLRLKEGFVLRGYVFRSGGNGNEVVWAMPAASSFPGPNACPRMECTFLEAPRPPEAIDPMEAVDGDGTPLSYLWPPFSSVNCENSVRSGTGASGQPHHSMPRSVVGAGSKRRRDGSSRSCRLGVARVPAV